MPDAVQSKSGRAYVYRHMLQMSAIPLVAGRTEVKQGHCHESMKRTPHPAGQEEATVSATMPNVRDGENVS